MNYAPWLRFTLSGKWCLASEKISYKRVFSNHPLPSLILSFTLSFGFTLSILRVSLIKIPLLHSKLSSFATEKCFCVITVITVLKAVDLSITPGLDNIHIDWKRAARAAVATRCKCQAEQNATVLFWHLWPPFYRQELIKQSDKDVGKVALNASTLFFFLISRLDFSLLSVLNWLSGRLSQLCLRALQQQHQGCSALGFVAISFIVCHVWLWLFLSNMYVQIHHSYST